MRILIADSSSERTPLADMVRSLGSSTQVASSLAAVQSVDSAFATCSPFELIVLDLSVGELECATVVECVRDYELATEQALRCGIVLTTGDRQRPLPAAPFVGEIDAFLPRPFPASRLVDALSDLGLVA